MRLLSHFENNPLDAKYLTVTSLPLGTVLDHFQRAHKESHLRSTEGLMYQRPGQGGFLWRE